MPLRERAPLRSRRSPHLAARGSPAKAASAREPKRGADQPSRVRCAAASEASRTIPSNSRKTSCLDDHESHSGGYSPTEGLQLERPWVYGDADTSSSTPRVTSGPVRVKGTALRERGFELRHDVRRASLEAPRPRCSAPFASSTRSIHQVDMPRLDQEASGRSLRMRAGTPRSRARSSHAVGVGALGIRNWWKHSLRRESASDELVGKDPARVRKGRARTEVRPRRVVHSRADRDSCRRSPAEQPRDDGSRANDCAEELARLSESPREKPPEGRPSRRAKRR